MNAIRRIEKVKAGSIKIDLPADFQAKEVEVIILPLEQSDNGRKSLQDLLLDAPTINDDELQHYNDVREWMNSWHAKEF